MMMISTLPRTGQNTQTQMKQLRQMQTTMESLQWKVLLQQQQQHRQQQQHQLNRTCPNMSCLPLQCHTTKKAPSEEAGLEAEVDPEVKREDALLNLDETSVRIQSRTCTFATSSWE
jgi:TolA-binding protein